MPWGDLAWLMVRTLPKPSRRMFGALLLSLPLVVRTAAMGWAAPADERIAVALRGIVLPYRPADLTLVRLTQVARGASVDLDAVVRLTWAPGMRQRRFAVSAPDEAQAVQLLLGDVEAYFASLGPDRAQT